MGLFIIRGLLVLLALAAVAFVVRRPRAVLEYLRNFFLEPSAAGNLAVLRIIVFYALLKDARRDGALWYADLPLSLRAAPPGWGWLQDSVIYEPRFLAVGVEVQRVAAACALLGLFTRISVPTAVLCALYVGSMGTFFSKVSHGTHLAVMSALVLSVSPCGDAFSLDRLWKRLRGYAAPAPSVAYGLPVRICWILLGTTYLFPGFWKLWLAGDLWVTGESLRFFLISRWGNLPGFVPPFRIDEQTALLALLGSMTVLLELGFMFAIFHRTGRVICALSMMSFHLGVRHLMSIKFPAYMPLILLLDFPQLGEEALRRLPAKANAFVLDVLQRARAVRSKVTARVASIARVAATRAFPARRIHAAAVVGALLITGQVIAGVAVITSFPISVYPLFAIRGRTISKVVKRTRIYLESRSGERIDLREELSRMGPSRTRKLFARITTARTHEERRRSSRALIDLFRHLGGDVKAGDLVLVCEESWTRFPIGEQRNYREKVTKRFRVTKDDTLKPISGKGMKTGRKATVDRSKKKADRSQKKGKKRKGGDDAQ